MARTLAAMALLWPLAAAWAIADRAAGETRPWTAALYLAASRVCHQRPERSFHTAGVQWPVCGRCSGLYLGAPIGAMLALSVAMRRRHGSQARSLLIASSLPTAATLIAEFGFGLPISNALRSAAALPLGAAIAAAVITAVSGTVQTNQVN